MVSPELVPAPPKQNIARSRELDGLRGIAALAVVFRHFFDLFPETGWTALWKISPLYLLIAGREAVVIFFVLSGFALHRMYLSSRGAGYRAFVIRRTLRIYGPYLAALAVAVVSDYLLSRGWRPHFSPWFNRTWTVPFRWYDVWTHLAFLGVYNNSVFDTAFWSLVHEMRISIVFPLLCLFAAGRAGSGQVSTALSLLILGSMATATFARNTDIGDSVHFAGLFILGIFISERKGRLAEWYGALSPASRIALVMLTLFLFCYGRLLAHAFPEGYASLLDLPVALAASGIVVLAFSSPRLSAYLDSTPVAWLGKVSYSLYLVHGTILFGLINLLNLRAPRLVLLALYLPLALFAAGVFHAGIERPLLYRSRKVTAATEQLNRR